MLEQLKADIWIFREICMG